MATQHAKLDSILEQLTELSTKIDHLTELLTPAVQSAAEVTQLTQVKPDAEALNRLQEEKSRASSNQQIDDAQLIQLYTFEKTGKRDYRDPSNVPAGLLQAAREWDANGRPDVSEIPYRMYGG